MSTIESTNCIQCRKVKSSFGMAAFGLIIYGDQVAIITLLSTRSGKSFEVLRSLEMRAFIEHSIIIGVSITKSMIVSPVNGHVAMVRPRFFRGDFRRRSACRVIVVVTVVVVLAVFFDLS